MQDLTEEQLSQRLMFIQGYAACLKEYAWWKDGTQLVGAGLKTYEAAVQELKFEMNAIRNEVQKRNSSPELTK